MENPDLAAALASRICHDLVSPVGAVVNGVDLLRETGPADLADTVGMIAQSAGRASALLQFYRVAFGAAEGEAKPIGRSTLRELASVLAQPPRITIGWEESGPAFTRPEARLISLLVLAGRSALGLRGAIRVQPAPDSTFPLAISIESAAFSKMESWLGSLSAASASAPISPRSVEFILARSAAENLGVALQIGAAESVVTISATISSQTPVTGPGTL